MTPALWIIVGLLSFLALNALLAWGWCRFMRGRKRVEPDEHREGAT
jgi:hypothetical protein